MITDYFRLEGKKALITGAGKGIGARIATAFAEMGRWGSACRGPILALLLFPDVRSPFGGGIGLLEAAIVNLLICFLCLIPNPKE